MTPRASERPRSRSDDDVGRAGQPPACRSSRRARAPMTALDQGSRNPSDGHRRPDDDEPAGDLGRPGRVEPGRPSADGRVARSSRIRRAVAAVEVASRPRTRWPAAMDAAGAARGPQAARQAAADRGGSSGPAHGRGARHGASEAGGRRRSADGAARRCGRLGAVAAAAARLEPVARRPSDVAVPSAGPAAAAGPASDGSRATRRRAGRLRAAATAGRRAPARRREREAGAPQAGQDSRPYGHGLRRSRCSRSSWSSSRTSRRRTGPAARPGYSVGRRTVAAPVTRSAVRDPPNVLRGRPRPTVQTAARQAQTTLSSNEPDDPQDARTRRPTTRTPDGSADRRRGRRRTAVPGRRPPRRRRRPRRDEAERREPEPARASTSGCRRHVRDRAAQCAARRRRRRARSGEPPSRPTISPTIQARTTPTTTSGAARRTRRTIGVDDVERAGQLAVGRPRPAGPSPAPRRRSERVGDQARDQDPARRRRTGSAPAAGDRRAGRGPRRTSASPVGRHDPRALGLERPRPASRRRPARPRTPTRSSRPGRRSLDRDATRRRATTGSVPSDVAEPDRRRQDDDRAGRPGRSRRGAGTRPAPSGHVAGVASVTSSAASERRAPVHGAGLADGPGLGARVRARGPGAAGAPPRRGRSPRRSVAKSPSRSAVWASSKWRLA